MFKTTASKVHNPFQCLLYKPGDQITQSEILVYFPCFDDQSKEYLASQILRLIRYALSARKHEVHELISKERKATEIEEKLISNIKSLRN